MKPATITKRRSFCYTIFKLFGDWKIWNLQQ